MNASRRICCQALNAFRLSAALRSVFAEPISQHGTITRRSARRGYAGVRYEDVYHLGKKRDQGPGVTKKPNAEKAIDIDEDADDDYVHTYSAKGPKPASGDDGIIYRSPKLQDIAEKKAAGKQQEVLEYTGQYVEPTGENNPFAGRLLPWVKGLKLNDGSINAHTRLGTEIEAFAKWIRPSEEEVAAREEVIKQTSKLVHKFMSKFKHRGQKVTDVKVEPFGSSRNGLGLAQSDVDLRLYQDFKPATEQDGVQASWMPEEQAPVPPQWKTRRMNIQALIHLQHQFFNHGDYLLCNIRHARYPLLHMQHKASCIDIQIVCANDTSEQRSWIKNLIGENPHIVDIYAVFKTLLELRGLTDVYRGGIGSYGILILILAALNKEKHTLKLTAMREGSKSLKAHENSQEELGKHMMQVTRFITSLNTYTTAVAAQPVMMLPKLSPEEAEKPDVAFREMHSQLRTIDHSQPYLLCLIDPRDPTNDLGRQAYGIKHIQETIRHLSSSVVAKVLNDRNVDFSSFLAPHVGAAHQEYGPRRLQAKSFGKAVLRGAESLKNYVIPETFGSSTTRRIDLDGKHRKRGRKQKEEVSALQRDINMSEPVENSLFGLNKKTEMRKIKLWQETDEAVPPSHDMSSEIRERELQMSSKERSNPPPKSGGGEIALKAQNLELDEPDLGTKAASSG